MSRRSRKGTKRGDVQSDINITPLVDVVLVLLIIFMVTTSVEQQALEDLELPFAGHSENPESSDRSPFMVTVDRTGGVYLATDRVNVETLRQRAQRQFSAKPDTLVVIKADERARFSSVREVFELLKASGANQVSVAAEGEQG